MKRISALLLAALLLCVVIPSEGLAQTTGKGDRANVSTNVIGKTTKKPAQAVKAAKKRRPAVGWTLVKRDERVRFTPRANSVSPTATTINQATLGQVLVGVVKPVPTPPALAAQVSLQPVSGTTTLVPIHWLALMTFTALGFGVWMGRKMVQPATQTSSNTSLLADQYTSVAAMPAQSIMGLNVWPEQSNPVVVETFSPRQSPKKLMASLARGWSNGRSAPAVAHDLVPSVAATSTLWDQAADIRSTGAELARIVLPDPHVSVTLPVVPTLRLVQSNLAEQPALPEASVCEQVEAGLEKEPAVQSVITSEEITTALVEESSRVTTNGPILDSVQVLEPALVSNEPVATSILSPPDELETTVCPSAQEEVVVLANQPQASHPSDLVDGKFVFFGPPQSSQELGPKTAKRKALEDELAAIKSKATDMSWPPSLEDLEMVEVVDLGLFREHSPDAV